MSIIVSVQLSVFSNSRIEPLPENITSLMSDLNSLGNYVFLPSVMTGQNFDLISKQLKNVTNLAFFSTDQLCQIVCFDNRIDVTINNHPNGSGLDLNKSLAFAKCAMKIVQNKNGILGNRLALNIHILCDAYTGSFSKTIYGKEFYVPLAYYKDKELNEWSTRTNARVHLCVGTTSELSNIITDLTIVEEGNGNQRVLCHLDINTLAENQGLRFNSENLDLFISDAAGITMEIKKNIEEVGNHA